MRHDVVQEEALQGEAGDRRGEWLPGPTEGTLKRNLKGFRNVSAVPGTVKRSVRGPRVPAAGLRPTARWTP
ncbi:hypothetical protein GCM10010350_65170 [Streptomyces galilaeus]|nr:hypothetical protein GCM10010350_65170 [Streptomyces galilaeus]